MELEIIILYEINQMQKNKYFVFGPILANLKDMRVGGMA
jgi:hypothetical protein